MVLSETDSTRCAASRKFDNSITYVSLMCNWLSILSWDYLLRYQWNWALATWNGLSVIPNQWLSHSLAQPFMFISSSNFCQTVNTFHSWILPQKDHLVIWYWCPCAHVNCQTYLLRAPRMMQRKWCGERRTELLLRRAGWGRLRKLTACIWWGNYSFMHIIDITVTEGVIYTKLIALLYHNSKAGTHFSGFNKNSIVYLYWVDNLPLLLSD